MIFTFLCFFVSAGEFPITTATGRQYKPAMAFGLGKYRIKIS
jgi:hypothetical protein